MVAGVTLGKSSCFSRAGKMPVTMTSSALASACANSELKKRVRRTGAAGNRQDLGLRVAATGRIQQRSDFGRMMRVIIDDRHLADGATDLEAACGAEERGDRRGGARSTSMPNSAAAIIAAEALRALWMPGTVSVTAMRRSSSPIQIPARNMQREMFGSAFGGFASRFDAYQRGTVQVAQFGGVPC